MEDNLKADNSIKPTKKRAFEDFVDYEMITSVGDCNRPTLYLGDEKEIL